MPHDGRSTVRLYEEMVKYHVSLTSSLELLHYVEDVGPDSRRQGPAS